MHVVTADVAIFAFYALRDRFRKNLRKYYKFVTGVSLYVAVFVLSGLLLSAGNEDESLFAAFSLLRALGALLILLGMIGV
jgi:hypothetical protein